MIRRALDAGMRYFDTAPSYAGGRSERHLGAAIAPFLQASRRGELFIATKTLERTAAAARKDLESSLRRLGLEYVDAWQVHEVHDDWERIFESGGVLEAMIAAREEGLVRAIGITGHRNPDYLVKSIERFPFDSALVPINPLEVQRHSFIRGFVPKARERGVSVIAMKVFAGGHLVGSKIFTAAECLRYALSIDGVAVAVPGCSMIAHVDEDVEALSPFTPLDVEASAAFEARAGRHEGKSSEWYKE